METKQGIGARVRISLVALVSFVSVSGCGAPGGSLPSDVGESSVGSSSEAILEGPLDRPPAAAGIGMMVDGVRQLWVFGCGDPDRNVLQLKTLNPSVGDPPGTWSEWGDITGDSAVDGCAGTPAVGAWSGSPYDELEVLYRGLNNELHEFYVDPDGGRHTLNLSKYLKIGPINGDPVIADMGSDGRIAVIVRLAGDKLTSLDIYSHAWHKRPVLDASGAQVISSATVVGAFDDQSYGFFSAQVSPTQHLVFTRKAWDKSFTQLKGPISSQPGLLAFGHLIILGGSCAPPNTCVISRTSADYNLPAFAPTKGSTWSFSTIPDANYISDNTFWPDGGLTGYNGAGQIYTSFLQTVVSTGLQVAAAGHNVPGGILVYQRIPTFSSAPSMVVNSGDNYAGWSVINLEGKLNVFHGHNSIWGVVEDIGLTLSTQ